LSPISSNKFSVNVLRISDSENELCKNTFSDLYNALYLLLNFKSPAMKEAFLHYIWLTHQFDHCKLTLTDGQSFEIVSYGKHNHDSGPDFLHARIKINDTILAGHIEIHTQSSEWYFHGHEKDEAYRNIILHVVWNDDSSVFDMDGHLLPTFELKQRIDPVLLQHFERIVNSRSEIPCAALNPAGVDDIYWGIWKERLVIERLQSKLNIVKARAASNINDWEELLYQRIAVSMAMKVNGAAMDTLTQKLPLHLLRRQRGNATAMMALLFGMAGLKSEWSFLRKKHDLVPMQHFEWKYARLRPSNFPDIRLMQLSHLLNEYDSLLSEILRDVSYQRIVRLLNKPFPNEYWDHHYRLGVKSEQTKPKNPGKQLVDSLIINAIVPVLFLYAYMQGDIPLQDRAIDLLQSTPAEKNTILQSWQNINVKAMNAGDSQALIHLKNNYCEQPRCLECSIGHQLIGRR